jgi:hypothetical protein
LRAYRAQGWTRFHHPDWEQKLRVHYRSKGRADPDLVLLERQCRPQHPDLVPGDLLAVPRL